MFKLIICDNTWKLNLNGGLFNNDSTIFGNEFG